MSNRNRGKTSKAIPSKLALTLAAVAVGAFFVDPAFASGGLTSASTAATNFNTWFYSFVGILAGGYLTYKGVEAWTDRAQWSDFGIACAKVAAVGGVTVLAPWLWAMFTS